MNMNMVIFVMINILAFVISAFTGYIIQSTILFIAVIIVYTFVISGSSFYVLIESVKLSEAKSIFFSLIIALVVNISGITTFMISTDRMIECIKQADDDIILKELNERYMHIEFRIKDKNISIEDVIEDPSSYLKHRSKRIDD